MRQTFFLAYFRLSPLLKHVRKVVGGFGKKRLCQYCCEKARKHMCVTDRQDMTLVVKVELNPNTTNQVNVYQTFYHAIVGPVPLTLSQTSSVFLRLCRTSLLKTLWEKEKLLVTSNFSFSHSVFYCFGELSAIFIKFEIVVCNIFPFGRV